jgi:integrative and conjugative element protein (TIGR02256 family)
MIINNVLFAENSITCINNIIAQHEASTEIGGALVGFQCEKTLIVTHASGAGNKAKMAYDYIEIDGEYTTQFCNQLNNLSDQRLYFLGDWHTHLSDNLKPSIRDQKAMKRLSKYMPKPFRNTLITVIVNHYSPHDLRVYKMDKKVNLQSICYSSIPTPLWVSEFIK